MKIVGVIPARYASTRFPGKPLADICGKPMIWWVYNSASKVSELDEVYVATDSEKIAEVCKQYDMKYVMTSETCPTGTDRVAEVAEKVDADIYVNIQGDEPLIKPETIAKTLIPYKNNENPFATVLITKFKNPIDVVNPTEQRVIFDNNSNVIYITRAVVPYPYHNLDFCYYKQVCIYAFTKEALSFFSGTEMGKLEKTESIELLRFIENDKKIKCVEVESDNIAVDTEKDLERIRKILENGNTNS
jgi:3-deoxy-manno-octulosonate cytidylyltransferase (CMP-KDO synthetase)